MITIIILLILAAITINLTIGQRGIITRAQEAGRNYQEAAAREEEELAKLWEESENILKGNIGSGETGGSNPTPPEGGDEPTPPIPSEPEISEEVKGLKTGDYIKYDTGVTSVGENGIVTCRVLYPVDSKYGLQIITNHTIGEKITLGGGIWEEAKTSYNNAIKILNSEAGKYINLQYAYDGRCVGSMPEIVDGMFINKNTGAETTVKFPKIPFPTGWSSGDTECFDSDDNYISDFDVLRINQIFCANEDFWYASRYVMRSDPYYFCIHYMLNSGSHMWDWLCTVNTSKGTTQARCISHGLRPCISLKSNIIKITGGDGKTEETAYTLGI